MKERNFIKKFVRTIRRLENLSLSFRNNLTSYKAVDQLDVQLLDGLISGITIQNRERQLRQIPKCFFQDARTICINYRAVRETDFKDTENSILRSYPNPFS